MSKKIKSETPLNPYIEITKKTDKIISLLDKKGNILEDNISFEDLFEINEIQHIQDLFAKATGVASIITYPDGRPITKPSNFCRLCNDIIRKTEIGLKNCYASDSIIGRHHPSGPIVQTCLSGGLWDSGASITVGGKHIANWLIGQVRNEAQSEEKMKEYAKNIGANEKNFLEAFREVPKMSKEKFEQIAEALFAFANQLSIMAYQNVQKARYISERAQTEELLKKQNLKLKISKEKAEEVSKIKSNFLASMSHELRTPMIGILGFSEILCSELQNDELKKYAEMISSGGKRLLETLNLLLDISIIEAQKVYVEKKTLDIIEIVKSVLLLFENAATKKNITLQIESVFDNFIIQTDEQIIIQILNNLINNAIKFTKDGIVKIVIDKEVLKENNYLSIKIIDSGIGIPKEMHKIIWEEFRQVSEGRSRSFTGTGLGLTIAKKLVAKLDGEIWLESSEPGKGSTFKIIIPYEKEIKKLFEIKKQDLIQDVEEKNNGIKHKILYIEDDYISINLVEKALKNICQIDTAKNAVEGIEKAKQEHYSAVFMDINLGRGMDGIEATKIIKKIHGYKKKPIVAVTAFAMSGDKEEFLKIGCTHYISKPFVVKELQKLVQSILN